MANYELQAVALPPACLPEPSVIYELGDNDLSAPPVHTVLFLLYELGDSVDKHAMLATVHAGLQDTLRDMPIMAGSLAYHAQTRRPHIVTTSTSTVQLGIRHLENDHASFQHLAKTHFRPDQLDRALLTPPDAAPSQLPMGMRADPDTPILYTQVTFLRGGLVLGLAAHHWVADAGTLDIFLTAFARKARARSSGHAGAPVHISTDRSYFSARRLNDAEAEQIQKRVKAMAVIEPDTPTPDWPGALPLSSLKSALLRFSPAKIQLLKSRCQPKQAGAYVSTYDCTSAVLWRAMTRARADREAGKGNLDTAYLSALNVRGRGAPENYVGNALCGPSTGPVSCAEVMHPDRLADIALSIRTSLSGIDAALLRDTQSLGKHVESRGARLLPVMRLHALDVLGSSWRIMQMDQYDLGFGLPAAARTPAIPVNSVLVWYPQTPAQTQRDGQVVFMVLIEQDLDKVAADPELLEYAEIL